MRDLKTKLTTPGKGSTNIPSRRGKSFGYHVLGFGAGGAGNPFIVSTGGTITTSGDYKIHTFTGPGTFTVTNAGSPTGSDTVEYLVVAGGGGGGRDIGGGGGAGGFRSYTALPSASPLNGPAALPVSVTGYPITVGGGGAGTVSGSNTNGSNSVFSTITSAGGGAGGGGTSPMPNAGDGAPGGSGGGVRFSNTYSTYGGAAVPVSPPQGQRGGGVSGGAQYQIGGGGGATQQGEDKNSPSHGPTQGGAGGDGSHVPTTFIGPTAPSYGETGPLGRYFSGGGGGGGYPSATGVGGLGGGGGPPNENGATNTGGGGTGGDQGSPIDGNAGGSGIVIIRYKYQ